MNQYTHEGCGGTVEIETLARSVGTCRRCSETGNLGFTPAGDGYEVSLSQADTAELTEEDMRAMREVFDKHRRQNEEE